MIALDTARQLLDFRGPKGSLTAEAAEEQLRGAVAVHNILQSRKAAYLADEVGMGKTYVALGAVALFRHFNPDFRLLVIAPRKNIQTKWMKELRNFVRNNVRFPDLRVKAVHGAPARSAVACHSLVELVRETSLNPDRDFFARLSSFSLALAKGDPAGWKRRRDELLKHLPWADREDFDLGARKKFKDTFARAVCAALPVFDLVIVDEGHNLKRGFSESVAARNRVLALAFGHPSEERAGSFPGYGPRARRVLFLSATPLENDYVQLWNQLNVFGFGDVALDLCSKDATDDQKRACAQEFLIRRVTQIPVGEDRLTKNQYRREWRSGGVSAHDAPLEVPAVDRDRQRLIVALVQKKVSEVLRHERFNSSFQIGMLASFESFLETAKVTKVSEEDEEASNFDDPDQTDDADERLGLDVGAVNSLARSYRQRFGKEMPHPKMDALVDRLAEALPRGEKALVFVRRVASVKELQAKLEERYDEGLIKRLCADLPEHAPRLMEAFHAYHGERKARRRRKAAEAAVLAQRDRDEDGSAATAQGPTGNPDNGGIESFFAYFFRGEGPAGILSGAALAGRFTQASSAYSTFFDDNYVAWLLDVQPDGSGSVLNALAQSLGRDLASVKADLLRAIPAFLPLRKDRSVGRQHLFFALQLAALGLLARQDGPRRGRAEVVLQLLENSLRTGTHGAKPPANSERWLEEPTFFTELRARPALRSALWPAPSSTSFRDAFREQELRRLLLGSMARLGHAFIDIYVLAVRRIGNLKAGARELEGLVGLMRDYLDLLDRQRMEPPSGDFRAFQELAAAAHDFDLIIDVNAPAKPPDFRSMSLVEVPGALATLLGRQQPIGGMFGQIDSTLVRQFRMPGYPLVLVTTDLLQEGEDLHTYCSSVYHYGISWMPSSLEQRVGRIDRVNSATERRLTKLKGDVLGDDKLQVYYPHLRDTVELLQIRRVLTRLNRFLRLMHRDLGTPDQGDRQIHIGQELHRLHEDVDSITEPLQSAFPIRAEMLRGPKRNLAVDQAMTAGLFDRFRRIKSLPFERLRIDWEAQAPDDALMGTVRLTQRQQPFTLLLRSLGGRLMVRCLSPIGHLDAYDRDQVGRETWTLPVQVAAIYDPQFETYNLATEREILLGGEAHDLARIEGLIGDVVQAADDLEARLLQLDQLLEVFRDDLNREADHA